jgi:uncharacterized protein YkwD
VFRKILIITILCLGGIVITAGGVRAESLAARLAGRILLAVEDKGQAWYVSPENHLRYFLGRPADAFNLMRELGVGITNRDLKRIPIGFNLSSDMDSDGDGLVDSFEDALGLDKFKKDTDEDGFTDYEEVKNGYNPTGAGVLPIDLSFSRRQAGKIFLAVERHGEAWYVNPIDGRRYFLGRPVDAFNLMRSFGLGITNSDLNQIPARTTELSIDLAEKKIFQLINQEREGKGLVALAWNDDLANVARSYSQYLARENEAFTGFGVSCDYPLIHHQAEGFGPGASDRLKQFGVNYFSRVGENLALVSAVDLKISFVAGDPIKGKLDSCAAEREELDTAFREKLEAASGTEEKLKVVAAEIKKRKNAFKDILTAKVVETRWHTAEEIAVEMVDGWMASPGHRKNILEAQFDESGVGVAIVNTYIIATQIFIKRADCGFAGGPCCEKEGYYPYCFIPLECKENQCVED